jgi:hypothetical protein
MKGGGRIEMNCPRCGKEMEVGHLGMERLFSDVCWFKNRTLFGFGGVSLGLKDRMGLIYADAYRCEDCKLVTIRY